MPDLHDTYESIFGRQRPLVQSWLGFVTAGHEVCASCGGGCRSGEIWLCREKPDGFVYKHLHCPTQTA